MFDNALDMYHKKQSKINLIDAVGKDSLLRKSCSNVGIEGNDDDEVSRSLPSKGENLGEDDI